LFAVSYYLKTMTNEYWYQFGRKAITMGELKCLFFLKITDLEHDINKLNNQFIRNFSINMFVPLFQTRWVVGMHDIWHPENRHQERVIQWMVLFVVWADREEQTFPSDATTLERRTAAHTSGGIVRLTSQIQNPQCKSIGVQVRTVQMRS
jgi:hypothetical protein